MISLEKIQDNKDPLEQGRVLTDNGDWLHPICDWGEGDYSYMWVPPPGAIAVALNKQYYIGTSYALREKTNVER